LFSTWRHRAAVNTQKFCQDFNDQPASNTNRTFAGGRKKKEEKEEKMAKPRANELRRNDDCHASFLAGGKKKKGGEGQRKVGSSRPRCARANSKKKKRNKRWIPRVLSHADAYIGAGADDQQPSAKGNQPIKKKKKKGGREEGKRTIRASCPSHRAGDNSILMPTNKEN